MTNKEIEEKIASMERELVELKSKLVESETIEPKEGEEFWFITGDSRVVKTTNCLVSDDKQYIETGNYFKTKEEATKQAEYNRVMNRFRKYVEVHSEPLDWSSEFQNKYYLVFDNRVKRMTSRCCIMLKSAFEIYASSEQILKDAMDYSAGSEEEFTRIVFGVKDVKN